VATDVSGLALGLYEALLDGVGLMPAVLGLANRIGASSHTHHVIGFRQGRPAECVSAGHGGIAGGPALAAYSGYWVRHDPWVHACAELAPGIHDLASRVPAEALRRTRIWNEWARPNDAAFHVLAVPLARHAGTISGLFFHRRESEVPFDGGDRALLEALFPHLQRIFAAAPRLAPARQSPGAAMRAGLDALPDGVALLDADRRLVFVNAALRLMIAQRDGLALAGDGLLADGAAAPALNRAVTAALAAAYGKVGLLPAAGSVALPRRSGLAPWLVRAVPVLPTAVAEPLRGFRGAMLIVTDSNRRPRPAAALLARLFGLTPAEAALAASLATGRTLTEHAQRRGVSSETARTQLAAIRRKTGCRRQSELAALFARLPG
jgi:DNA-binding CsgD family transcriptional regulator